MNKKLFDACQTLSADKIRSYLNSDASAEIYKPSYKACDVASLFVAAAYITENGISDKAAFRKKAYMVFLSENRSEFTEAWSLIDMLTEDKPCTSAAKIRVLKGSSYKIKNYYLENFLLKDIRGASVLLTHVEETVIPGMISDRFIPECIVYCGGGNIFAILPESCDEHFALELEATAKKLLISADVAYYISEAMSFTALLGSDYKEKMNKVENKLNDRKKLIINSAGDRSEYFDGTILIGEGNEKYYAAVTADEHSTGCICDACGKRTAYYEVKVTNGTHRLCASCLHKRSVGEASKKNKYSKLYKKYTGNEPAKNIHTLEDITGQNVSSAEKYISIVYGDGNNMGGIIQNFRKITEMMEFSRDVKTITEKAAFEAMGECGIDRFEVVGLGGDDIFVIVDGKKAVAFTIKLIEKYNEQFRGKYAETSTLSAGIAIAKHRIPIQVVLEKAEDELSRAKDIAKKKKDNCGSLSFVIFDSFDGGESLSAADDSVARTMLPYYTDEAKDILGFAQKMKDKKLKTKLRNIQEAFENAESPEEANLFLAYMNAKEKEDGSINAKTGKPKLDKRIFLPDVSGYTTDGGYYTNEDGRCYIWNDLLSLMEFCDDGRSKKQ
ncbi:MAG: hypothetical protein J6A05_06485 [Oscillospiraceae bacterium]|nr:hypothetical protein [Oscillospiraceae bacterium]